jgi:hypothetical protein
MLGYEMADQEDMINAIHDAKLFYIANAGDGFDTKPEVDGLLMAISFLQGLYAEGYFD